MKTIGEKKEKYALISALIAFVCGWGLTIAGFIVEPLGEVSNSVLAILGEAMVYAASVFGVAMYFNSQMTKFRADAQKWLEKDRKDESAS